MNKKQTVVMWVAILVIVVMCLYPPWAEVDRVKTLGWSLIWLPHKTSSGYVHTLAEIDFQRLYLQFAIVVLITGGLIVTLRTKKKPSGD